MLIQLFGLAVLFIVIYWYLSKPKNLPPGPSGVPLLGYLPWILYYSRDRNKLMEKLKKYGNIVCIRLGFSYMVFLGDLDTIKDAFATHGDDFSGRGLKMVQSEVTNCKGIVSSQGKYQRENRRFILRSLRNMGFGKISFEEHILESVENMCGTIDQHITEHPNKSLNFRKCIVEAVADSVSRIVLGIKFDKKQLLFITEALEQIQVLPEIFLIANSFPFILPLMRFQIIKNMVGLEQFKQARGTFETMVFKYVQDHRLTMDPNNISDFLYSYIEEQGNHQNTKEEAFWWDDDQIKHACVELIGAGVGTTDATISWLLFLMASDQKWSRRVTDEIDSVIGRERKPSTRDLPSLPLCEATVLETLRWSSLVPMGIPHSTTVDTHLQGYFIPKDVTVMGNLFAVSRDKSVFADPDHFNPAANFLAADEKEVIHRDKIIPFSIGRRSCIGESLARMEIILFFLVIFQKYTVSLDPEIGMAPFVTGGIFRNPGHRIINFQPRA